MAKVKTTQRGSNTQKYISSRLERAIRPILRKGVDIREEYVKDWSSRSKPTFKIVINTWYGKMEAYIQTAAPEAAGSTAGYSAYRFLQEGTRVRRAELSGDWRSKSAPNSLTPRSGAGKVIRVSKRLSYPGIKARNTDILAAEAVEDELDKAIANAFR